MLPYAFAVDPELRRLERSATLRRMSKLEIVLYADEPLIIGRNSVEMMRRIERACDVLQAAKGLREATISWIPDAPALEPQQQALARIIQQSLGCCTVRSEGALVGLA